MAAGLILFGLAGYVFVTLTGRTLSNSEANAAIAFYFLVNVLGPGIFYALEQVTSRTISSALAAGQPPGPALRRVRVAGAGLVAVVVALLLVLAPVMVGATLHDDWALFAGVLATPAIAGGLHLVRGLLGGTRRFGGYAVTLAVEGTARLLLTGLLAVAGVAHAWTYGAAYLAASVIAIAAGVAWLRRTRAAETADTQCLDGGHAVSQRRTRREKVGRSLGALAVATLFAQLLPNLAPLVVTSRLAQDSADALAFGQAAVIARIPVLLFFPIQTMLLPSMSAAVARRELGVLVRRVRLTLVAVGALGAVSTVLFVLLGRWVLRTFFGTTSNLSGLVMLLLAVSTVVLIAAYAAQPALVALHRDRVVTAGWAVGSAITLGLALLPADPLTTASVAQVVGPALTLAMVLLGLHAALRSATSLGPTSLGPASSACPPCGTHETADTCVPNGGHAGVGGSAGSAHSA